ncbi:uncharacterized protein [Argopecten irradians]|uniref:uncharacterized protein n=1 Tax=Argopecten irradians TaxID=31199 RepID=UPI0037204A7C
MAETQYTIMNEELGWDNKEEMFCDTEMSIQIEMHGNRSRDAYSFTEMDLEYGRLSKENNEELDFSDFSQKIEPNTNIQHESSSGAYRSYIIPPLSLTPSSGHYHDTAGLSSMKIEPENRVQTCYIAGAEQRERTLSELCEAESIINKGTDEITNTQSVGMSIYQRETTTCMNDIEPGEGTLIRSLVSDEPSIKTESDLEDGVYGSGQTPGPDLQTIPSDVSVCSEADENTRQDDNTEPGEATLGQSFIGESLIKTEPMDSQHEFEGLMYRAKQSTACVTVLLPDNGNTFLTKHLYYRHNLEYYSYVWDVSLKCQPLNYITQITTYRAVQHDTQKMYIQN